MSTSEEQALVARARHDPQAFAALYDRFVERVFRFALRRTGDRPLAEDVTSATFEKALRHLRRSGWKGSSYLAWLYRLAYQQVVEQHRRNHRFVALASNWPADANVEQQAQSRLRRQAVSQAFQRLAQVDQEVLALRLFDRLSSAEAAEVLGCSKQNVYVRLYRALARLREQLVALGEISGEESHDAH